MDEISKAIPESSTQHSSREAYVAETSLITAGDENTKSLPEDPAQGPHQETEPTVSPQETPLFVSQPSFHPEPIGRDTLTRFLSPKTSKKTSSARGETLFYPPRSRKLTTKGNKEKTIQQQTAQHPLLEKNQDSVDESMF
ncbi:hypothetical protein [Parashewanella curva]|uniref:hypothetical protein n=1 Tax=Parashewanella curva TaxID=2338552 RepID=UPI0010598338|nr:hypothetical protein [Parashewanella curva]